MAHMLAWPCPISRLVSVKGNRSQRFAAYARKRRTLLWHRRLGGVANTGETPVPQIS